MWEKEKDEFEARRNEFFQKRDTSEELLDLQNQEIAKLKHMVRLIKKNMKELLPFEIRKYF